MQTSPFKPISPLKKIAEEELILLLKERDKAGFEYLYDNYSKALYGIIFKIVKTEEVAAEVLHDAFMKVWEKAEEYDPSKGRLFTWLLNIARNQAIDKTRSKEYKLTSKSDSIDNIVYLSDSDYDVKNNPEHIGVAEMLNTLTDDQKKLIDLMYFQGYSQSEISEEYNIPLGTVKTRVRTAMQKLRSLF